MEIQHESFGILPNGQKALVFILKNKNGMSAYITNYGGTVNKLLVPDKNGNPIDVALGHVNFEAYIKNEAYYGSIVGRNSNRIENATFCINGKSYCIDKNDGNNNIHGGYNSLSHRLFKADVESQSLILTHCIKDMSDKFPGNLNVKVTYTLTDDNALKIDYHAVCDSDSVINLTNHTYFNLDGHESGTIHNHVLELDANYYSPNRGDCLPNGEIRMVENTPFDFRRPKRIGDAISSDYDQIKMFGGIDHNYVLNASHACQKFCTVTAPNSGIKMEVFTDLPGVQIYTGNMIDVTNTYKNNTKYQKHQGICFETQFFPNSVNIPWLASPIYPAGKEFLSTTIYKF